MRVLGHHRGSKSARARTQASHRSVQQFDADGYGAATGRRAEGRTCCGPLRLPLPLAPVLGAPPPRPSRPSPTRCVPRRRWGRRADAFRGAARASAARSQRLARRPTPDEETADGWRSERVPGVSDYVPVPEERVGASSTTRRGADGLASIGGNDWAAPARARMADGAVPRVDMWRQGPWMATLTASGGAARLWESIADAAKLPAG